MRDPGQNEKLHVEGVILARERTQPRTRLGPVPAPEEVTLTLHVDRAWTPAYGDCLERAAVVPRYAGEPALLEGLVVGDRVRIICTTLTGSLIEQVERID